MTDELDELNAFGVVPRPWPRQTEDGHHLCDWCGHPFRPPKATGRTPRYCRRSCRQRAYEARQTRREIRSAVGAVLANRRQDSSRDETRTDPAPPPLPLPRSGRRRASMTAAAMPLPLPGLDDDEDQDDGGA